jgi:phosphoglycerate-specific signal transduction histidine kinase
MGMIEAVCDILTSEIGITFVRFGVGDLPPAPYGVVKGERGVNGRLFRIILHDLKDQQEALEERARLVVKTLQNRSISHGTVNNRLGELTEYTDVAVVSDDNTIAFEVSFTMPTTLF